MPLRPNSLYLAAQGSRTSPTRHNRLPQPGQNMSPRSPRPTAEEKYLLSPSGGSVDNELPALRIDLDYINPGQEEQSEIYGYERSNVGTAITWVVIVATAGLLRLVFHWMPQFMLWATHRRCSLSQATRILIVEHYKKYKRCYVKQVLTLKADQIRWFSAKPCRPWRLLDKFWFFTLRVLDARLEPEYSLMTGGVAAGDGGDAAPGKIRHDSKLGETMTSLPVPNSAGIIREVHEVRLFRCKKLLYLWDDEDKLFYRLPSHQKDHILVGLRGTGGLSWQEQARRRVLYGPNAIKVPIKPISRLLFLEALNPFYIFQVLSVLLWFLDDYIYYATVIVVTSVVSLISEVYQMHQNQLSLSKTIQSSDVVEVVRADNKPQTIPSEQLVPGDILLIPSRGCMMQCDAVLLQGNAIVNESMLTGESVPVTKIPVTAKEDDDTYSDKELSKHTLYCGTQVIQTRFYGRQRVCAVVIRTGFLTNKGSLVRSIMYPPPVDFKFQQDSYKFVLVLVVIASFGFVYTVVTKYMRGVTVANIALDSLDLITIVIPPALPMAMTVGILHALRRLNKQNIFCISPRSVNISGVLNCVCFDKTGTLTEDGLDMKGVVPVLGLMEYRGSFRKQSMTEQKYVDDTRKYSIEHTTEQKLSEDGKEQLRLRKYSSTENKIANGNQQSSLNKHSLINGKQVASLKAEERNGGEQRQRKHSESSTKTVVALGPLETDPKKLPRDHLLYAMASCHSITIISMELVGDPLELKMFETTGWVLEEPGIDDTNKYDMMTPSVVHPPVPDVVSSSENGDVESSPSLQLGILRQFPFESTLQCMSVITSRLEPNLPAHHNDLYCKGSPEKIASLSLPETVPANFTSVLQTYTDQGHRVLALGHRPITMPYHKLMKVSRKEVECNLQFLGLLVMENRLKEETKPVIKQLRKALVRTIMVTGDNLLTALSVGRECGLVSPHEQVLEVRLPPTPGGPLSYQPTTPTKELCDESMHIGMEEEACKSSSNNNFVLAIDGKTWAGMHKEQSSCTREELERVLVRGVVFARMNPDQKQQLIIHLQGLGYYVGMCGDGANDCGALKAAHAGISLSEAEASVASPFTSKDPNISCVPTLIREGRTALVTSFGIFKYMAAYSLTQFVSIMILYSIESNLTDLQFLYVDLFLITVFAVFFGRTESYKGDLHPTSPPASLMSVTPIMSLLLHMFLVITFQTCCFFYVQDQPWYVPFNATTSKDILAGHENYAVFSISQFQYIILAVAFSRGPPYRQTIFTNYLLCGSIVLMTCSSVYLTVWPSQTLIDILELVMPPENDPNATFFRYQMVLFALLNSALAMFIEYVIVDYFIYQKLRPIMHNAEKSKKKYISIENRLKQESNWPPTSRPYEKTGGNLPLTSNNLIRNTKRDFVSKPIQSTIVVQYQSSL